MTHSSEPSRLRARGEYSPLWLMVPLACIALVLMVWFVVVEGGGIDDATPAIVDSIDTFAPETVAQHGA